jgi:hypothetical protein
MELRSLTLCWADVQEAGVAVTDEQAGRALGEGDWPTIQTYVLELLESDLARGIEWLGRLEAEARKPANAGDKYAQSVMGGIETWRYLWRLAPATESLERALEWFVMAARQVGGEPMMEQVRHWYQQAQTRGLRFAVVESFFADPEVVERHKKYAGTTLWEPPPPKEEVMP